MTRKKAPSVSIVRSSAAEYLTFVAAAGGQSQSVEMRYEDENLIFADRKLEEGAVVKRCLIAATEEKNDRVTQVGAT